jgi:hypothetical protein
MEPNQMRCCKCDRWVDDLTNSRCVKCHAEWTAEREAEDKLDEDRAIAKAARDAGLVVDGKLRTILGQVSITADGAVVGHHFSTVYYIDRRGKVRSSTLYHRGIAKDCYSTRSAAEAAKGGGDAAT